MKNSLNQLFYFIHISVRRIHLFSNKINPVLLLFKIPILKKRMRNKFGIENPMENWNEQWNNDENGLGLMFSQSYLVLIFVFILIGFEILLLRNFDFNMNHDNYLWILYLLPSYLLCYFLVFKNNKYLNYFEKYKSWSKVEKRRNDILSIAFITSVLIFWFGSMIF
jgi:hypothetical protein